jgi:para-nitrobenzyl esterase
LFEVSMNAIATTQQGRLEGREKEGTLLFAGIPYATPPLGALRLLPPEPHEAWSGVRDAKRFGLAAPQRSNGGLTSNPNVRWSEDCLTLNVTTPALDDAKRPVLVWIHGGDFRNGQGGIPWYNGARFATQGDVVVVSLNYRLGALGFTHLPHLGSQYANSGVVGLLDQIAGLEWVRDNIEAFGGDPARVTIAGESAGAYACTSLLSSPRAQGLFRAAILQSGAGHRALPPEAADKIAQRFCELLEIRSASDLQRPSPDAILDAQAQIDKEFAARNDHFPLGVAVSPFYPVIAGDVLPQLPIDAFLDGFAADIPVLIGTNADETTLWTPKSNPEGQLAGAAKRFEAGEVLESYRRARPNATERELLIEFTSDYTFRIPAIRLAEAREKHGGNSWMYYFRWKSRAFGGRLGATHSLEIPFAFDNLDRAGVDVFLGEGEKPQGVANVMHAAWTAFIRTGDPAAGVLADWPVYASPERTTAIFDDICEIANDPDTELRRAWDGRR